MRPLTNEEMQKYSTSLCQQGLAKENEVIRGGTKFTTLSLTKKGLNYVDQFIVDKPEMFLLIFLDIMTNQKELNNG